jgi:hypothetical protein
LQLPKGISASLLDSLSHLDDTSLLNPATATLTPLGEVGGSLARFAKPKHGDKNNHKNKNHHQNKNSKQKGNSVLQAQSRAHSPTPSPSGKGQDSNKALQKSAADSIGGTTESGSVNGSRYGNGEEAAAKARIHKQMKGDPLQLQRLRDIKGLLGYGDSDNFDRPISPLGRSPTHY